MTIVNSYVCLPESNIMVHTKHRLNHLPGRPGLEFSPMSGYYGGFQKYGLPPVIIQLNKPEGIYQMEVY